MFTYRRLSRDRIHDMEIKLTEICDCIKQNIHVIYEKYIDYPSIFFGLEAA